jgi:predicted esterase
MNEHHLSVSRTARYFTLGEPAGARDIWFVLHGYGQLAARFLSRFEPLVNGTRLIVAPEGLSRFYVDHTTGKVGSSWMTKDDRAAEIGDYLAYLDDLYDEVFHTLPREGAKVTVLGFSQGAVTASRWVSFGAVKANRLIIWGEVLAGDLDMPRAAPRLRGLRLIYVNGRSDHMASPDKKEAEVSRLREYGIEHQMIEFDGGHRLDDEILLKLA